MQACDPWSAVNTTAEVPLSKALNPDCDGVSLTWPHAGLYRGHCRSLIKMKTSSCPDMRECWSFILAAVKAHKVPQPFTDRWWLVLRGHRSSSLRNRSVSCRTPGEQHPSPPVNCKGACRLPSHTTRWALMLGSGIPGLQYVINGPCYSLGGEFWWGVKRWKCLSCVVKTTICQLLYRDFL